MPWFAVDDGFHAHPKRMACSPAALGVWVTAGSWAASQLTDGFIPRHALPSLGGKPKDAQQLVDAGLWSEVDGGWTFHDFHSYNPTAEEVRAERAMRHEAKVRAGRAGGIASGVARRKHSPKQTRSSGEADTQAEPQQNEAPSRTPPVEEPPTTSVARIAPEPTGPQAVVAAYVDAVRELDSLIDPRAKGRIAKDAAALLRSGAPLPVLIQAARRLATNGYADLGAEARRLFAEQRPRPSTTDQRVAQGLALVAHFEQQEGA